MFARFPGVARAAHAALAPPATPLLPLARHRRTDSRNAQNHDDLRLGHDLVDDAKVVGAIAPEAFERLEERASRNGIVLDRAERGVEDARGGLCETQAFVDPARLDFFLVGF